MQKKSYLQTIMSLYANYFFQGIATIIVSQNMSVLRENWGASVAEVSLVLSAIGVGRILSINVAGFLSDKLGRRMAIILGNLSYILFFIGLLWSPNYIWAFLFSVFAGFGNAFLDTGTYPVVVEAFSNRQNNSALSVLNKSFISLGQFVFPIITSFLLKNGYYFGWTFLASAFLLAVNLAFILNLPFPERAVKQVTVQKDEQVIDQPSIPLAKTAKFQIEGVALLIFSFVSVSLFNIFITWIPSFAQEALKMAEADSLVFVSAYSIFSFVSVFMTSFIVKRGMNVPRFMMICTSLTGISLLIMIGMPSLYTALFATFCVGFFAAGGIWQLGLAILLEFFPLKRGIITSYYSLATSISVMGLPYLTGMLAENHLPAVFLLIALLAFLGTACLYLVHKRYTSVFGLSKDQHLI